MSKQHQKRTRWAEDVVTRHRRDVDWRMAAMAIELDCKGELLRLEQIANAVDNW